VTETLVYLDSSAIVKLAIPEPESPALLAWLAERPERVTSAIAHVEVRRTLRRAKASTAELRRAIEVVDRIALIPIDRAVIEAAAEIDPPELRSLDALHLAAALSVGAELAGFVTYDQRLAAAAARARIEVWSPGAE
jgi:hypothetical protein